jgi:1,4-dihydroxy-2-naphthoate octaprenyltransferase
MNFKVLLIPIKPFPLVSLLATYALGAGLVQYVESMGDWSVFLPGGLFLILWYLAFRYLDLLASWNDRKKWPEGLTHASLRRTRWMLALTAATLVTSAMAIFVSWMVGGALWQGLTVLIFGFVLFCAIFYLTRLWTNLAPYRLLFETVLVVIFPPAIAFFLQTMDHHRFLTMVVVGLVPFYIAYRILSDLKSFGEDQTAERITVVTSLGWEKAMVLHNALILVGFLVLALVGLLGFPWFLLWPVFLTFPIGLLEIWLMERVRRGGKPLWAIMQFAAGSVFLIPMYLLGFAFWIR